MELQFLELRNSPSLRLEVNFADWDRQAVNGNSLGLMFVVYSDHEKPGSVEIILRNDGAIVGRLASLRDDSNTLDRLCPSHRDKALYGSLSINRLLLNFEGKIAISVLDRMGNAPQLGEIRFTGNDTIDIFKKTDAGLTPILISSLGRSGSTVLCNSLSSHPDICNIGGYPFEYRFFSYCLQAIYVLTSPANHQFSMGGDSFEVSKPFDIGFNPFNHREYDQLLDGKGAMSFFERKSVENVINFSLEQSRDFLRIISTHKPGARYFVEKMAGSHLAALAHNVVSGVQEIVLIRDFWNMIESMVAFDLKRGTTSFLKGDPNHWLLAMAFQHANLTARSRLPGRILVRYENLVAEPKATLQRLLEQMGLALTTKTLNSMLTPYEASAYQSSHSTSNKVKEEVRALFSKQAVEMVSELLKEEGFVRAYLNSRKIHGSMQNPDDSDARLDLVGTVDSFYGRRHSELIDHFEQWQADYLKQLDALTQRVDTAETYNRALLTQVNSLKGALDQEQQSREVDRVDALRQIAAHDDRASRAETYNHALLAELARCQIAGKK